MSPLSKEFSAIPLPSDIILSIVSRRSDREYWRFPVFSHVSASTVLWYGFSVSLRGPQLLTGSLRSLVSTLVCRATSGYSICCIVVVICCIAFVSWLNISSISSISALRVFFSSSIFSLIALMYSWTLAYYLSFRFLFISSVFCVWL